MRVVVFLFLVLPNCIFAQPQHSKWFFGFGAGLDMSTVPPTPDPGPLSTDEGCASICDATGQLLFFSNGERVWDRNRNVMPDGEGLFGSYSSTQSALITPVPENPDRYLIFTTPAENAQWGGTAGLHYSIVDMTLNNGLGDVLEKNIPLSPFVTEKITATRHANGVDIWVVVHAWDSNEYHAYLVSCTGVEGPVVSAVGRAMGPKQWAETHETLGCMKISEQSNRLASVWTNTFPPDAQSWASSAYVDVLDFDSATGVLSNVLMDSIGGQPNNSRQGYGVAFSPNGNVLYVSESGFGPDKLWQYDLGAADPTDSEVVIGDTGPAFGTIQLGPGNKLYIARLNGATHLSVVNNPDVVGIGCDLVHDGVDVGSTLTTWGLPNHWDTYPEPVVWDPIPWTDSLYCTSTDGIDLDVTYPHPFHTANYAWCNGSTDPVISITEPGMYSVEIMLPCTTITDTVFIRRGGLPVDLGPDISACEGDELFLSVDSNAAAILWNTGSDAAHISVESSGIYSVAITDSLGCVSDDEIRVEQRDCLCPMYLPNAFSPNNDGINDLFHAAHNCTLLNYALALYDRWGEQIFFSDAPDIAWDGTVNGAQPVQGIYTWALRYSWDDGEGIRSMEQHGHVTTLR